MEDLKQFKERLKGKLSDKANQSIVDYLQNMLFDKLSEDPEIVRMSISLISCELDIVTVAYLINLIDDFHKNHGFEDIETELIYLTLADELQSKLLKRLFYNEKKSTF